MVGPPLHHLYPLSPIGTAVIGASYPVIVSVRQSAFDGIWRPFTAFIQQGRGGRAEAVGGGLLLGEPDAPQRAVERLSTLRMVVSALKNKEIEQRTPVTDAQALQVLTGMIKQRKDSIEQFTKGNRPELAEKEAAEITVIEEYMPKAAGDEELRQLVTSTLDELRAQGAQLGPKDMGTVMKAVQVRIQASGLRADGRVVSEMVKAALAG